jgi:hypothetical protein
MQAFSRVVASKPTVGQRAQVVNARIEAHRCREDSPRCRSSLGERAYRNSRLRWQQKSDCRLQMRRISLSDISQSLYPAVWHIDSQWRAGGEARSLAHLAVGAPNRNANRTAWLRNAAPAGWPILRRVASFWRGSRGMQTSTSYWHCSLWSGEQARG